MEVLGTAIIHRDGHRGRRNKIHLVDIEGRPLCRASIQGQTFEYRRHESVSKATDILSSLAEFSCSKCCDMEPEEIVQTLERFAVQRKARHDKTNQGGSHM